MKQIARVLIWRARNVAIAKSCTAGLSSGDKTEPARRRQRSATVKAQIAGTNGAGFSI